MGNGDGPLLQAGGVNESQTEQAVAGPGRIERGVNAGDLYGWQRRRRRITDLNLKQHYIDSSVCILISHEFSGKHLPQ